MAKFCERCGRALQDGEECGCAAQPDAQQQAYYQPTVTPDPQQTTPPQTPPAPDAPPQGYYAPPAAQPQQPGYGQPPQAPVGQPHQQPPQAYGQPGGPAQPVQPGQPANPQMQQVQQQVQQTFGEVTNVLGGFAKDPVGAAAKVHNPVTALVFLVVQAICYTLWYAVRLGKISSASGGYITYGFGDFMMGFLYVLIGIAVMFGCVYVMALITKIQIDPMKMLSSLANASIPVSACYLAMMLVTLIFGNGNSFGGFLNEILSMFGIAAGICLLEIGIRSQMPQGQGNVARLLTIAVSFAVTCGIGALLYQPMLGDAGTVASWEDMLNDALNSWW